MSIYNNITNFFNILKNSFKSFLDGAKLAVMDKNALQQGFILIFIIFVALILYNAIIDKEALLSKTYLYIFLSVIPVIFILSYSMNSNNANYSGIFKTFILGFIAIFFCGLFYFMVNMNTNSSVAATLIINFILFLIITIGLGIFFIIFSNNLKSYTGLQGFIIYLIFYIPCLVVDFFRYLIGEYKSTSNDVIILFAIEIGIILLYIYLPKLLYTVSNSNGIVLLEDSVFLDIPYSIDTNIIQNNPPNMLSQSQYSPINFRKNYAISLWTYLDTESPNNAAYSKESLIFSYGRGKPMITYYNQIDQNNNDNNSFANTEKYIVYFTNSRTSTNKFKKINLPSQKWNNLVFNYFSDHVDLFINGSLEFTYTFDAESLPSYEATDMIKIGSQNGLNGAVCNVRYYTEPLSRSKIVNLYNLLAHKNPPTFINTNASIFN
jgi:hypothetical protein